MAIKVILKQDISNLGSVGEVKQVSPGYFRNFLQPRGLAVEASKSQVKALENEQKAQAGKIEKGRERAGAVAQQLTTITIRIPVKLGEQGRLYGSVTNKDIADALAEQVNMTVDRHRIDLREPLKSIGTHSVPVKLEHGIDAQVDVELVPEGEPTPA